MTAPLTDQQVFDQVLAHSRTQRRRAVSPQTGRCRYRAANGDKCFFGALIPDAAYTAAMECMPASIVWQSWARSLPHLEGVNPTLLDRVQVVHDRVPVELWEVELGKVAALHNLAYIAAPLELEPC